MGVVKTENPFPETYLAFNGVLYWTIVVEEDKHYDGMWIYKTCVGVPVTGPDERGAGQIDPFASIKRSPVILNSTYQGTLPTLCLPIHEHHDTQRGM
jgi:hypothetical protein